jgi:hypothetical protein
MSVVRHRTVRKTTRYRRRQFPTRWAIAAIAVLLLLVAGWHYLTIYLGLTAARDDLLAAKDRLNASGFDVRADDIVAAQGDIADARSNLNRAHDHFRYDPLIRIAGHVPKLGDQVNAAGDILDMADLLVDIGDEASVAGTKVVALRDGHDANQPLTQALITLLNDTDAQVTRLNALTQQLVKKRQELGDRPLIGPLDSVRTKVDEELPTLANGVERVAQAKALLPGFLGFDGDRNYLVFALNSGELLPGGGLVTAAGIMPISKGVNGSIDFTDSTLWKGTAEQMGIPYITPPGPLQRYLLRDYTWNLLVANWSPDFPTWSQQALEFYQLIHGKQPVDGIISVDLTMVERLLGVTGPKAIDVPGRGPVTFDQGNAVLQLEALTRQPFEPTDDRKSVIGQLAEVLMADLLKLPSEKWGAAVDVILDMGEQRHLQVLSFNPREQTLVRDAGWDGRLLQTPGSDFFSFNEASLLSTKLNLIIKPEGTLSVNLNELGDARHQLSLTYNNPLPEWSTGKDPKLVSQLMLGGLYGGYLRIFAPAGLSEMGVSVDGTTGNIEDTGNEEGRAWFGTMLPVGPGETKTVTMSWRSGAVMRSPNEYRLTIEKQPGTDGACIALDIKRGDQKPSELVVSGGTKDAQGRICLETDVEITARFS